MVTVTQKQNNQKLSQWYQQHNIYPSANIVSSSQVIQKLIIKPDPEMKLSYSNLNNVTVDVNQHSKPNGIDDVGASYGFKIIDPSKNGSETLTFSNISSITYKGRPISKIVEKLVQTPLEGKNTEDWISQDFYYGINVGGASTKVDIQMYYSDGTPVNFTDDAYLAVASLNNYSNNLKDYSIESTQVLSGGKALGLLGSSVTPHNGTLYADKANSYSNTGTYLATTDKNGNTNTNDKSFTLNPNASIDSNIPKGWDNANSPDRYYGAGLIQLQGSNLSLKIFASKQGIPQNALWRNWMWWNASSLIPETPDPHTQNVSVHYHYDNTFIFGN